MTTVAVSNPEIDSATAPQLAKQLDGLAPGADVLVDFAEVTFCDSTGIRVLLAALKHQMAGGGSLRLINVTPAVSRVFEMTGLRNLMADVEAG
jgi:anti-sigma B factor antagonist